MITCSEKNDEHHVSHVRRLSSKVILFQSRGVVVEEVELREVRKAQSIDKESSEGPPNVEASPEEISIENYCLPGDDAKTQCQGAYDCRCEPVSEQK